MYGSRGRIGLLVPSVNTVVEAEGRMLLPMGYAALATRMRNEQGGAEDMARMCTHIDRGVDELLSARVDVIAFACTAGSFFEGDEGERALSQRLRGGSDVRTVTAAGAVAAALHAVGARRVSMVTPYDPYLNELEVQFLTARGFEVVSEAGMDIPHAFEIGIIPTAEVQRYALEHLDPRADALFLSCTNLPTIQVIESLEQETGVPVVTSNQATYWDCLRSLGFEGTIEGYGRLLRQFQPSVVPAAAG
ncbi:MAG: maleate cis-trans isomerase [Dehalococcoidia bacterium]|nr:maleate cis-trans isomerase [Dehalococcoidia bacterium]